jgi:hypothetical protein
MVYSGIVKKDILVSFRIIEDNISSFSVNVTNSITLSVVYPDDYFQ